MSDDGFAFGRCVVLGCENDGRVHLQTAPPLRVIAMVCRSHGEVLGNPDTYRPGTFFDRVMVRDRLDGWYIVQEINKETVLYPPGTLGTDPVPPSVIEAAKAAFPHRAVTDQAEYDPGNLDDERRS